MTRAYIRIDPELEERKGSYPDGPYRVFVDVLCLAEQEPRRGRFRSRAVLAALLGKRARHLRYLFDHGDLTTLPNGRVYVVGWDEWQEGDWQVAERMALVRSRRRSGDVTSSVIDPVTPEVVTEVTPATVTPVTAETVTPDTPSPVTPPSERRAESSSHEGGGGGGTVERPPSLLPIEGSERDSLDTYYELTGSRPWGKASGRWLHELEEKHGLVRLDAALRGAANGSTDKLIERAAASLERAADQRPIPSPVPVEEQRAQLRKAAAEQRAKEEAAAARVAEYRRTHDPNTGMEIEP